MPEENKLKLVMDSSIIKFVTCSICKGFIINAMTINECLHTFCRSCIWRHFSFSLFCPECNTKAHQAWPLSSLQPDFTKQEIIYKLFPKLLLNEMAQRGRFWRNHPEIRENYEDLVEYGCGVEMKSLKICVTLERNKKDNVKGVYFKDDLIDADVPLNKIFIRIHSDAPMSCLRKLIINKLNSLGYLDNSLKVYLVRHKTILSDDTTICNISTKNDFNKNSLPVEFLICKSYDNLKSASNKLNNFGPNPSDNFIDVGMKEADDSKIFTALESSDKITSVLVTDDKEEAKKSPCELMRSPSKSSPSKSLHDENEFEKKVQFEKSPEVSQPVVENCQRLNDNESNRKRTHQTNPSNVEVPSKKLCNRSKIGKPVKVTSLIQKLDSNKQTHQTKVPSVVPEYASTPNLIINNLPDDQGNEDESVKNQPVVNWITAKSLSTNETVSPKVIQNDQPNEVITIPSSSILPSSLALPVVKSCTYNTSNGIVKPNNLNLFANQRSSAATSNGYIPQSLIRIANSPSNKSNSMDGRFVKQLIKRPSNSIVSLPIVTKRPELVQRFHKINPVRPARHISIINSLRPLLPKPLTNSGAVTNTAKFLHNQSNNLQTKILFNRPFVPRSNALLNTYQGNSDAAHLSRPRRSILSLNVREVSSIPFRHPHKLPKRAAPPSLIRMNTLHRLTNNSEKKMITIDFSQANHKKALRQSRPFVVQNKVKLKPTTSSSLLHNNLILKLPLKSNLLPLQSTSAGRIVGNTDETKSQDLPSTSQHPS